MTDLEKDQPVRLMIAGAQKAGTTSLLRYLSEHPGICTHEQLEMPYFVRDSVYQEGYDAIFPRYFPCHSSGAPIILAKSVALMLLPSAIARLHAHNPQVKIVVMLRNPIDRAYSHYWYSRRRGWEELDSFEAAIDLDPRLFAEDPIGQINRNYLANGEYVRHLQHLMDCFDQDQIQVILLEDLKEDPLAVCQRVFGLIPELDSSFEPDTVRSHNRSATYRSRSLAVLTSSRSTLPGAKRIIRGILPDRLVDSLRDFIRNSNEQEFQPPPMNLQTRRRLLDYYRPFNAQLSDLIKRNLDHWDV